MPGSLISCERSSLCLALNEGTRGFLDGAKLGRTKPGVIFVNTARADIVDTAALARLLVSGHIRHAAIDVFTPEPPLADNPLLTLENVTITAHAGFMTPEATMTMLRKAIDIVIATGCYRHVHSTAGDRLRGLASLRGNDPVCPRIRHTRASCRRLFATYVFRTFQKSGNRLSRTPVMSSRTAIA